MAKKTKQFLFMYPINQYFNVELEKDALFYLHSKNIRDDYSDLSIRAANCENREERYEISKEAQRRDIVKFRPEYFKILNRCIYSRYRKNNFCINYLVFNDCDVTDSIDFRNEDRIGRAGITYEKHTDEKIYPNLDYILDQFDQDELGHLRLAGFHMWDCVDKLAKRANERGIDVLVDEDLTQFLIARAITNDFVYEKYPGFNPIKHFTGTGGFQSFMEPRLKRPWLLQKY